MSKSKTDGGQTKANTLQIVGDEKDRDKFIAQTALRPSVQAAITSQQIAKSFGALDLSALVQELQNQIALANGGDLGRGEAMLVAQAHSLDMLFNELARRSALNMGEYMDAAERYMRLALKAQSQCRVTIETLAEIKNPRPVAFVQQANIANGPQQINNGTTPAGPSRAEETKIAPNKLLESDHGERLDFRASGQSSESNTPLGTLEEIDRANNIAWKKESV